MFFKLSSLLPKHKHNLTPFENCPAPPTSFFIYGCYLFVTNQTLYSIYNCHNMVIVKHIQSRQAIRRKQRT